MDIHLPHRPIHGIGEFFLHLFTITVGLLIAVSIEGCVEWQHHRHLAREARARLLEKIEHNSNEMPRVLTNDNDQIDGMKSNIAALNRLRLPPNDKAAQTVSFDTTVNIDPLQDTAWKTAQATGALAYLPYDEAQRYTEIYGAQADFLAAQKKISEDEAAFEGIMEKSHFRTSRKFTAEEAGLLLERFGIWQGHLFSLRFYTKWTATEYRAFMEHKEAPRGIHDETARY